MGTLPGRMWEEINFRPQLINPVFLYHSGRRGGGGGWMGVSSEFLVGGAWLGSANPDLISDIKTCKLKYKPKFILSDQAAHNLYPI